MPGRAIDERVTPSAHHMDREPDKRAGTALKAAGSRKGLGCKSSAFRNQRMLEVCTSAHNGEVAGSSPAPAKRGGVAQLVER